MKIDELRLMRGNNIPVGNICTVRQPTLNEIAEIGYDTYNNYLSILLTEKDSFATSLQDTLEENTIKQITNSDIHIFNLIMLFEETRQILLSALSFFICEEIRSIQDVCFGVYKNGTEIQSVIEYTNYNQVRDTILEINCIKIPRIENLTFTSEASRERYMKLLEHREKTNKTKNTTTDVNQKLPNLIGAISARSHSYNYLNIWGLTIYQLYDQFKRIHSNTTMDIAGTAILLFGGENNKFDETFWFKNYEK